jgi:hypothetical protein
LGTKLQTVCPWNLQAGGNEIQMWKEGDEPKGIQKGLKTKQKINKIGKKKKLTIYIYNAKQKEQGIKK